MPDLNPADQILAENDEPGGSVATIDGCDCGACLAGGDSDCPGGEDCDCDPFDDPNWMLHPIKWTCDGATTIAEGVEQLEGLIGWLVLQAADGWELEQPVDDGHFSMRRPAASGEGPATSG